MIKYKYKGQQSASQEIKEVVAKLAAKLVIPADHSDLVEHYVDLKKQLEAVKPIEKQVEEMQEIFRQQISDDVPADQEVEFIGHVHKLILTARQKCRTCVDMEAVHKILGNDAFYALCAIKLSDIDAYLTNEQKQQLLHEARTGPRFIRIKEL